MTKRTVRPCIHPGVWLGSAWEQGRASDVMSRASEAGFEAVVVPLHNLSLVDIDATRNIAQDAGLSIVNSMSQTAEADVSSDDPSIRQRGIDRLKFAVEAALSLGSEQIDGVLYGPLGDRSGPVSEDRFNRTAQILGSLADELRGDISLVLEVVNRYETPMLNTAAQGVKFIQASGSDSLKLHLDAFHMNIEEVDLHAAVHAALPWLGYLEISQNSRNGVTRGTTDLHGLIAFALAAGYRGFVGLEAFSSAVLGTDMARRLSIWRPVFPADHALAEEAVTLIRSASKKSLP